MSNNHVTSISTNYKVLEVREEFCNDAAPIVLFCEKVDTKERRRIQISRYRKEDCKLAQLVVAGDIITVNELVNQDNCRSLDSISVNFEKEEIRNGM